MSDIENSINKNIDNSNQFENGEDEMERIIEKKEEIGINTSAIDPEELKRLVENNPELLEEMKEKSMLSRKYRKTEEDYSDSERQKVELIKKQEEEKLLLQKKKKQDKIQELDEKE